MEGTGHLVEIIVLVIIALQLLFFVMNVMRMRTFGSIFAHPDSWEPDKDSETGMVQGIFGRGNQVFEAITESINRYLKNNKGSVIDFSLMKDAVDRHYDSVEEEIGAQTPVPLYCGLAGTMAGVIIGLWGLLGTNSIVALIGGTGTGEQAGAMMNDAAGGITDLLSGVAYAMVASICGIALTTASSLLFKRYKQEAEKGKNEFLAWMQAKLLPELPGDTSDALTQLVKNLNRFNSAFAQNSSELRRTLQEVNKVYEAEAVIIKNVHDMDVMKMANANVEVLRELQECTDRLEQFNAYLSAVKGYTDTIQEFNEQFHQQLQEREVLENISEIFTHHRAAIAASLTDEDNLLQQAFESLRETSTTAVTQLSANLTEQSDRFRTDSQRMCDEFAQRISQLPNIASRLDEVSRIPGQLSELMKRIDASNQETKNYVKKETERLLKSGVAQGQPTGAAGGGAMPRWLKAVLTFGAVVTTIAVVAIAVILWKQQEDASTRKPVLQSYPVQMWEDDDDVMQDDAAYDDTEDPQAEAQEGLSEQEEAQSDRQRWHVPAETPVER